MAKDIDSPNWNKHFAIHRKTKENHGDARVLVVAAGKSCA
jgi:hypothetical protein